MGSPVSETVESFVMKSVEERSLESFNATAGFQKQYFDDTCTVVFSHSVQDLLCHLDGDFTVEVEIEAEFSL